MKVDKSVYVPQPVAEAHLASIVLLGKLNPAIFSPWWFAANNLIRPEEAEVATDLITHNEIAQFTCEWLTLQVTPTQFGAWTTDPTKFLPLRDLTVGVFMILEHTPVWALGLNTAQHFAMPSEDDWHRFGHHFAPKETWLKVMDNPGMLTMTIRGTRPHSDSESAQVNVKIEPSTLLRPGVFIQVNNHYQHGVADHPGQVKPLLDIISADWSAVLEYQETVSSRLLRDYQRD